MSPKTSERVVAHILREQLLASGKDTVYLQSKGRPLCVSTAKRELFPSEPISVDAMVSLQKNLSLSDRGLKNAAATLRYETKNRKVIESNLMPRVEEKKKSLDSLFEVRKIGFSVHDEDEKGKGKGKMVSKETPVVQCSDVEQFIAHIAKERLFQEGQYVTKLGKLCCQTFDLRCRSRSTDPCDLFIRIMWKQQHK